MNIKMMLNDKSAIEELAKDPEIQMRIKDAIVDDIAKRAAKAAEAALNKTISAAVEEAMHRFMTTYMGSADVIKSVSAYGSITLSDKLKKKIQDQVDTALTYAAFDYAEKFPENDELKKALQRQVDHANKADVDKMIRESVDRIVADKFGGKR